jgi:hypothetical protein
VAAPEVIQPDLSLLTLIESETQRDVPWRKILVVKMLLMLVVEMLQRVVE